MLLVELGAVSAVCDTGSVEDLGECGTNKNSKNEKTFESSFPKDPTIKS